jgi:acetyl-CoA carboxylase biotin carboxyl carrier protein
MDTELIERLLDLMERSSLTEIEYDANGTRIHIVKRHGEAAVIPSERKERAIGAATGFPGQAAPNSAPLADTGPHIVKAALSGSFYRAPEPGAPPYVAVGDVVAEGDTLALIESMKLLNPVEADVAGRIVAAVAQESETVEMGATLFLIAPTGQ